MSRTENIKRRLNRLLGLCGDTDAAPDHGLERNWQSMREASKLSAEQKDAAWQSILERRAQNATSAAEEYDDPARAPDDSRAPHGRWRRNKRLRTYMLSAAASILIFIGAVLIERLVYFSESETDSIAGQIISYAGTVSVNDRIISADAKSNMNIQPGDVIETGPDGSVSIQFHGQNGIALQPHSRLRYDMRTDRPALRLEAGYLGAVMHDTCDLQPLHIESPLYSVEITGTTVFMGVPAANSAYFCICNGTVGLHTHSHKPASESTSGETVSARHHAAYGFERTNNEQIQTRSGELLYHNDALLEELADKIGTQIDWDKLETQQCAQ
ncbi:MAG: FecR domain-containing protein [Leptospiraceae bacterium]|nr:FecR domain-containing protein [Leptospiraceae bacterium]